MEIQRDHRCQPRLLYKINIQSPYIEKIEYYIHENMLNNLTSLKQRKETTEIHTHMHTQKYTHTYKITIITNIKLTGNHKCYLLMSININLLNFTIRRHRLKELIQNRTHPSTAYENTPEHKRQIFPFSKGFENVTQNKGT